MLYVAWKFTARVYLSLFRFLMLDLAKPCSHQFYDLVSYCWPLKAGVDGTKTRFDL